MRIVQDKGNHLHCLPSAHTVAGTKKKITMTNDLQLYIYSFSLSSKYSYCHKHLIFLPELRWWLLSYSNLIEPNLWGIWSIWMAFDQSGRQLIILQGLQVYLNEFLFVLRAVGPQKNFWWVIWAWLKLTRVLKRLPYTFLRIKLSFQETLRQTQKVKFHEWPKSASTL